MATCEEGGLGAVGVWQNVSPPEFLTPANLQTWAVAVNPIDESVFAAAGNITNGCGQSGQPACVATGVYKSTDCGGTWVLVSTGRGSSDLTTGDPWALRIDPVNPQNMYLDNGYGDKPTLYKSTNGGVDWDPLVPDVANVLSEHSNFVQAVAMDPAQPEHLVVTFHDNCTSIYAPNCMSETKDGGATWREFSGPPQATGWAEASSISILGSTTFLYGSPDLWGGFYTTDAGETWTQVLTGPMYGSYGGGVDLAPDGTAYIGMANTGVFYSRASSSSPLGAAWTLIPGSPQASLVADDGVSLFASWGWDSSPTPFYATPLDLASTAAAPVWTDMTSSVHGGPNMFAYDSVHHILYAAVAAAGDGVERVVTR